MTVNLIPGEFSPFTIAVAILSGFIVFFGYVSMFLKEKLFLSEAFVAVIVGIIAGPLVTNGINPYSWENNDEITKQLARCVIAIQVMAVGIDLPKYYLKKEWLTVFMLLFPVMLFMWLISGLIIWLVVPPINYLESLVIAACVCPTDPIDRILANSVVKGRFAEKHVPAHIRNALSAESGANDGLGFPFLFLAIFLLGEDHVGKAVGKWIYETCLFQIALSCVIGVIVGWIARKILQWSERNGLIDKPSFLSFAIALSLFLMSMTGFSGSDDVLACFAAGNAFSWDDWFRNETTEAHFQEVIDMMLNLAIFVYIGAIIPWESFKDESLGLEPWRLVVMAILILLFRRLPIVLLLKPVMPTIKTYREAFFSGWFGPMGVGAVFLSKIAKEEMKQVYPIVEGEELPVPIRLVNPVVLFIVLSSVFVHGTTIPLFKLGKRLRTRTMSFASSTSGQRRAQGPEIWRRRCKSRKNSPGSSSAETEHNAIHNTKVDERRRHQDSNSEEATLQSDYVVDMSHSNLSDDHTAEESILSHSENANDQCREKAKSSGGHEARTENTSSPDTHAIRFLEPTKPKTASQVSSSTAKNESTVSSVRSWIHRHASHDNNSAEGDSSSLAIGNFFRGLHRDSHHKPENGTLNTPEALNDNSKDNNLDDYPHIEVWEEDNILVIVDTTEPGSQIVVDKAEPCWRQKMKEHINELQQQMNHSSYQSLRTTKA